MITTWMLSWEILNARFLSQYTFPFNDYLTYTGIVEGTGNIKINKKISAFQIFTVSRNSRYFFHFWKALTVRKFALFT